MVVLPSMALVPSLPVCALSTVTVQPAWEIDAAEAMTASGAGAGAMAARDWPSNEVVPSLAGFPFVAGLMEAAPAFAASGERGLAEQRGKRRIRGRSEKMLEKACGFMIRLVIRVKLMLKLACTLVQD